MKALALAAGVLAWSLTKNSPIPGRRHPLTKAGVATALALCADVQPGLRGRSARTGLAVGGTVTAVIAAGVAAGTALRPVRDAMQGRELPHPVWPWLLVGIPLGTVWAEEAVYRGALGATTTAAFGPRLGRLIQAAVFGCSHIPDARRTGEPVAGTVLVTGAAGWGFALLAERSGSLLAPALAHLAVNEAGALAALLVQRRVSVRRRGCPC